MVACLKQIPGLKFVCPQGAFYIFCDISNWGENTLEITKKILEETKVAIIPGDAFGFKGFTRLSFATSCERIEEGTKRLKDWAEKNISG